MTHPASLTLAELLVNLRAAWDSGEVTAYEDVRTAIADFVVTNEASILEALDLLAWAQARRLKPIIREQLEP